LGWVGATSGMVFVLDTVKHILRYQVTETHLTVAEFDFEAHAKSILWVEDIIQPSPERLGL